MRVLAVDDDPTIRKWVTLVLAEDGYHVDAAESASAGRQLGLSVAYDLAIIDLDLPHGSGLSVVHALREAGRTHPIIIMTGNDNESAIVSGLDAGADDYVVKPVPAGVLRARVRAALRRGGASPVVEYRLGSLRIEPIAQRAFAGRAELDLTAREFALLAYLMQRPGDVVSRSELLERVWNMAADITTNVVDATMSRLRQKLQPAPDVELQAVRGRGYRAVTVATDSAAAAAD